MSSDNYLLIRKLEGKYVVTNEGASCPSPGPIYIDDEGNWSKGVAFDTYEEARDYAYDEWSEYGVEDMVGKEIHTLSPNSIYQFCWTLENSGLVDQDTADEIEKMMFDYLLWPDQKRRIDT